MRRTRLKDPERKNDPAALLSTDLELDPIQIVSFFIRRWTVEVSFEEVQAHLGVANSTAKVGQSHRHNHPSFDGRF